VEALSRAGQRVGWVTFGSDREGTGPERITRVLPAEPAACAALLYSVLHDLDAAGLDRIVVELPPDTEEWQAVRDRLRRAASL
jgi:L-threonylcarbamoyladenylate synthase